MNAHEVAQSLALKKEVKHWATTEDDTEILYLTNGNSLYIGWGRGHDGSGRGGICWWVEDRDGFEFDQGGWYDDDPNVAGRVDDLATYIEVM